MERLLLKYMKINKLKTHNLKLKTSTMLLFFIILLSVLLRLWKLGSIPPSLTPDEAALGYNAYSILNTGRGEYGKVVPIIFKLFGNRRLAILSAFISSSTPGLIFFSTCLITSSNSDTLVSRRIFFFLKSF